MSQAHEIVRQIDVAQLGRAGRAAGASPYFNTALAGGVHKGDLVQWARGGERLAALHPYSVQHNGRVYHENRRGTQHAPQYHTPHAAVNQPAAHHTV